MSWRAKELLRVGQREWDLGMGGTGFRWESRDSVWCQAGGVRMHRRQRRVDVVLSVYWMVSSGGLHLLSEWEARSTMKYEFLGGSSSLREEK